MEGNANTIDTGDPAILDAARQRRHAAGACAPLPLLEELWRAMPELHPVEWIRKPETGLVMLRGRIGGSGAPFNFGEATLTRCTIRWHAPDGPISGTAHVLGRSHRHAALVALIDAAGQSPQHARQIDEQVIAPIEAVLTADRDAANRQAAATRATFFTMVRSE